MGNVATSTVQKMIFPSPKEIFFTPHQRALLHTVPSHVAIIPDGNRRWATLQGETVAYGYLHGATRLLETALAAKELGVSVVTFFSFSTENWKRSAGETDIFLQLLNLHLLHYAEALKDKKMRLSFIGDIEKMPLFLQETMDKVTELTSQNHAFDLVLALNYGGRDELVRAFRKMSQDQKTGILDTINEELISKYLDTARWPDPDLLIRTAGEQRLSNFLLWQSFYTENYIEEAYWPDFSSEKFLQALQTYQERRRRRGGG
jgi:undecaprenyl diphosphate synthase